MKQKAIKPIKVAKVIILGDMSVGKTSIISSYLRGTTDAEKKVSIGAQFFSKIIEFEEMDIQLQIWDTAGQEKYRSITKSYFQDVKVAILVYDITNMKSYITMKSWIDELNNTTGIKNLQLIIVANKQDLLESQEVDYSNVSQFANNHNALLKMSSAKNSSGVEDIFISAANMVLEKITNKNLKASLVADPCVRQTQGNVDIQEGNDTVQRVFLSKNSKWKKKDQKCCK